MSSGLFFIVSYYCIHFIFLLCSSHQVAVNIPPTKLRMVIFNKAYKLLKSWLALLTLHVNLFKKHVHLQAILSMSFCRLATQPIVQQFTIKDYQPHASTSSKFRMAVTILNFDLLALTHVSMAQFPVKSNTQKLIIHKLNSIYWEPPVTWPTPVKNIKDAIVEWKRQNMKKCYIILINFNLEYKFSIWTNMGSTGLNRRPLFSAGVRVHPQREYKKPRGI